MLCEWIARSDCLCQPALTLLLLSSIGGGYSSTDFKVCISVSMPYSCWVHCVGAVSVQISQFVSMYPWAQLPTLLLLSSVCGGCFSTDFTVCINVSMGRTLMAPTNSTNSCWSSHGVGSTPVWNTSMMDYLSQNHEHKSASKPASTSTSTSTQINAPPVKYTSF